MCRLWFYFYVLLLLIGPPGQIGDFEGENTALSVHFSWEPPVMLAGTIACCLEYSIMITNINTGEERLSRIVTTSSLDMTLSDSEKCNAFEIVVVSRSELGWGEPYTTEWSLGGEPLGVIVQAQAIVCKCIAVVLDIPG